MHGKLSPDTTTDKKVMGRHRLNLPAIEASLRAVQAEFPRINAGLSASRDPLTDEVMSNMLAGYRHVDVCLDSGYDLFGPGASPHLLELNRLVLCGEQDSRPRAEVARQLKSAEQHFYSTEGGGVGGLMEWLELHRKDKIWKRAAGLFTWVLSQPQLYLEGNHRTGALLMSYLLVRQGRPPFVLTVENARHFFEPASLIKKHKKHGLDTLLALPKLTRKFAHLLEEQADAGFLVNDRIGSEALLEY